jgi:hypothetical protein
MNRRCSRRASNSNISPPTLFTIMGQGKAQPVDEVDYGAVADMHADDDDEAIMEEREDTAIETEDADIDDDESASSSGSDSDQVIIEEVEEESSGEEDDSDEANFPSNNVVVDGGDEPCTFDLRNLLAVNAHPVDTAVLYAHKNQQQTGKDRVTIPSVVAVDEKHLFLKAEAGCQQVRH